MPNVTTTERGYPGHFIAARDCIFRRNTLVTSGDRHIVVSTVGNYRPRYPGGTIEEIGSGRTYETMAFIGAPDGSYIEADVSRQVSFNAEWALAPPVVESSDLHADRMHDAVVAEVVAHFDAIYDTAPLRDGGEG